MTVPAANARLGDETPAASRGFRFAAYGLRVGVLASDPRVLGELAEHLPPGSRSVSSSSVERLYSIVSDGDDGPAGPPAYRLYAGGEVVARSRSRGRVLGALESNLALWIAEHARGRVFVHAGVVGWHGRAIVIPGRSFSGKSILVAALLRAGATYYSDEYAVLDEHGRVHPYPRPLSIRDGVGSTRRYAAEAFGAPVGVEPLPVGLLAVTNYRAGARWAPVRLSPGQAVLELLANTVSARREPAAALDVLGRAVRCGAAWKGPRGEAAEAAAKILSWREEPVAAATKRQALGRSE